MNIKEYLKESAEAERFLKRLSPEAQKLLKEKNIGLDTIEKLLGQSGFFNLKMAIELQVKVSKVDGSPEKKWFLSIGASEEEWDSLEKAINFDKSRDFKQYIKAANFSINAGATIKKVIKNIERENIDLRKERRAK